MKISWKMSLWKTGLIGLLLCTFLCPLSYGDSATVYARADTFTDRFNPDDNHGSSTLLFVGDATSPRLESGRGWVSFSTTDVPAGSTVTGGV